MHIEEQALPKENQRDIYINKGGLAKPQRSFDVSKGM